MKNENPSHRDAAVRTNGMKKASDWLVPVLIVVIAAVLYAVAHQGGRTAANSGASGAKAVPFTVQTVDGKTVTLSDYKGKVLLIDFWASWCPPCRAEAPNVVSAYRKYHAQGFDVLGISLDQDKNAMSAFEKEVGMTWPQVFDAEDGNVMATTYHVQQIPTMLLVDGTSGKILAEDLRGGELEEAVSSALKGQSVGEAGRGI